MTVAAAERDGFAMPAAVALGNDMAECAGATERHPLEDAGLPIFNFNPNLYSSQQYSHPTMSWPLSLLMASPLSPMHTSTSTPLTATKPHQRTSRG